MLVEFMLIYFSEYQLYKYTRSKIYWKCVLWSLTFYRSKGRGELPSFFLLVWQAVFLVNYILKDYLVNSWAIFFCVFSNSSHNIF